VNTTTQNAKASQQSQAHGHSDWQLTNEFDEFATRLSFFLREFEYHLQRRLVTFGYNLIEKL
jgi:hypothetical protein